MAYWKNYVNFNDRTSRAGYWWVVLMNFIISVVLSVITEVVALSIYSASPSLINDLAELNPYALASVSGVGVISIISIVWSYANLIPGIAIAVRRLHDIGRSWPWILISLIPIVGWIMIIVFMASPSKHPNENQFGYLNQV